MSIAECQENAVLLETEDGTNQTRPRTSEMRRKKKNRLLNVGKRLKDPFNKKKLKKMRQKGRALETIVEDLTKKLCTIVTTHPRGLHIVGSVQSLQIDCTNTIHQGSENGPDGIQQQIDNLTDAVNKLFEELTTDNDRRAEENTQLKVSLDRSEMKLEELKDLVSHCSSKISQHDVNQSQAMKELKDLQEAMLANLPDDKMVSDGLSAIRRGLIFQDEYDFLPFPTKLLVTRIVHLFGYRGLSALREELNMDITDDVMEMSYYEDTVNSDGNKDLILDKDVCTKVLIDWVNKSSINDSNALLQVMLAHGKLRFEQIKTDLSSIDNTSEDKSVQTLKKEETQYQSLCSLAGRHDSTPSEKSLSIDENYFTYGSLEMKMLQFVKLLSVEGIEA